MLWPNVTALNNIKVQAYEPYLVLQVMAHDTIILCCNCKSNVLFSLFSVLQQALATGGFPIAVPLQTNALNTGTQGGMTVNG